MKQSSVRFFSFALMLFAFIACDSAGFKAPPQFKKKKGESGGADPQVLIQTINVERAAASKKGRGEVQVTTSEPATITCVNCPTDRFPLNFTEKQNVSGSGRLYVAPFDHLYAARTELCRITIKIVYGASGRTENKNYGLFFCPVDQRTGQKVCDKANARQVCS